MCSVQTARRLRQIACLMCVVVCGCAGGRDKLQTPAWDAQRAEIEKIAPAGTPRDEVAVRLKNAGILFSPSGKDAEYRPGMVCSTFYCALWRRADGAVWPLDVALWFDDQGLLTAMHPANSTTTAEAAGPTVTNDAGVTAALPGDGASDNSGSPRSGTFRPFNKP